MNPKQILLTLLILVVLALVVAFYMNKNFLPAQQPAPVTTTATTTPKQPRPEVLAISKYLMENISTLSSITAEKDSKLVVSAIRVTNSTGTVEFKDGDKVYNASFNFAVDAAGNASVSDFKVQK